MPPVIKKMIVFEIANKEAGFVRVYYNGWPNMSFLMMLTVIANL